MERPLSEWERRVLECMASVEAAGADLLRRSLPHLVVTGGCSCGCPTVELRDTRRTATVGQGGHYSNGWTPDRAFGLALWLADDGTPQELEAFDHRLGEGLPLPDPLTIIVEVAGNVP